MATEIPGAEADPLSTPPQTQTDRPDISLGHRLLYIAQDMLLDWIPTTGAYSLWKVDRAARNGSDPLPAAITSGRWIDIPPTSDLIYLG
ncbi:MAG: hypothetical protein EON54_19225, partial [Alcaligenaceae bacterium]